MPALSAAALSVEAIRLGWAPYSPRILPISPEMRTLAPCRSSMLATRRVPMSWYCGMGVGSSILVFHFASSASIAGCSASASSTFAIAFRSAGANIGRSITVVSGIFSA